MFNKVEKRALEEQKEVLIFFLDEYGRVLECCLDFNKAYKDANNVTSIGLAKKISKNN